MTTVAPKRNPWDHVNWPPLRPEGKHDAQSPVVGELERRGIRFDPAGDGWVLEHGTYNHVTLWPGGDGKYGVAVGHQYAMREGGGFRFDWDGLMRRLDRSVQAAAERRSVAE